jgi:hypothetical protein
LPHRGEQRGLALAGGLCQMGKKSMADVFVHDIHVIVASKHEKLYRVFLLLKGLFFCLFHGFLQTLIEQRGSFERAAWKSSTISHEFEPSCQLPWTTRFATSSSITF